MNGEDLRKALRSEMAATTPPPPMSSAAALDAARHARVRRRTVWACIGAATAVLMIAGVSSVAGPHAEGVFNPAGPRPDVIPQPLDTKATGPDGQPQEDQTARSGPRYQQGIKLLDAILSVTPAGYTAPPNPENLPPDQMPLRSHQATFEGKANGADVWRYMSWAAMARGEQMGRLLVEVQTPGTQMPAEPCALTLRFWVMEGECQVLTIGAVEVGVVVQPGRDKRLDQWAAYKHPDGVVVFVAQSKEIFGADRPALAQLPFTVFQLAILATDERFHLK